MIRDTLAIILAVWLAFAYGFTLRGDLIYRGMFANIVNVRTMDLPVPPVKAVKK